MGRAGSVDHDLKGGIAMLKVGFVVLLLVGSASGCGSLPPTSATGNHISIQHGTARFRDAVAGANQYCAGRGMVARHVSTGGGAPSISTFECVAN
jgi:hypothetical protein